ncbi:MAG: LysM peptidoglycan-binding domain-containing protein, partial [Flavobacteriaceae bacterium]|nr:LysM peptidoglycan-binding domain-containing protein [Flavobacteriaceae bacterium]MBT3919595.1 LysM peptidoglycan-binding domain-containing protein [Flavobacteriaceae bacterium]MBT6705773.1 LysM peptidoglycan-binding domain-containing protein [Flavobacteriaceae bacterium]
ISQKFDVSVDALKRYNGLDSNDINVGQELYIHSVKN